MIEGEGWIGIHEGGARIQVGMTDEDVIRRLGDEIGGGVMGPFKRAPKRPIWVWVVSGFEKTQAIVAMVWHRLGTRRRAQAIRALTSARPRPVYHGDKTSCVNGHPFSEGNTYRRKNGNRQCRICRNAAKERWRSKQQFESDPPCETASPELLKLLESETSDQEKS